MFLASKFIGSRGCSNVSIQTVNSVVAILALYYVPLLSKSLYMKTGAGKNERIVNATETLSRKNYLLSLHAFLGCDSTSAFHGIRKRKWLNIVLR